jgi:hypothetical protein
VAEPPNTSRPVSAICSRWWDASGELAGRHHHVRIDVTEDDQVERGQRTQSSLVAMGDGLNEAMPWQ